MPRQAELRARRSALARTWESLLADGRPPAAPPVHGFDQGVLESWRRSAEWVRPDVDAAPVDGPDDAVASWRGGPVGQALARVEEDVRKVAQDGDLIAAVTDDSGRIVWTHGSPVMQRAATRVNFVPGGRWDESSVGTNALALALRTGRPSTVFSAEHYSRAVHGWVCYSVPLTDPTTRQVLGVLDLSTTWDRAHPLAMGAAQFLGGLVTAALPEPRQHQDALALDLKVLGGWQVRLGGRPLLLPRRQVEILVLLVLHPEGLSLESLHANLYGDVAVSTTTLKGEVSRLRTALAGAIGSRPYRLTGQVDSDVSRALSALERGDVAGAAAAAGGPLLPGSESPDIQEWRNYLAVGLRAAALGSHDPDAVRTLADTEPYDLELQEHLVRVLPVGDPRMAAARARVLRASS
jgi:hypothetical protein